MNKFSPKKLFLLDGLGAVVTTVLLSQVLARFEPAFGMPKEYLYPLVIVAAVFAVYSLACYFFLKSGHRDFLRVIALANTIYCIVTLGLVIYLFEILTWLGIAYFIGEIGIVMALVRIEWEQ